MTTREARKTAESIVRCQDTEGVWRQEADAEW